MSKDKELPVLSETQLEIMNVVWDHEQCSVADVWKVLNDRRGVTRNTVHTLMARLQEKGWLTHRDEGSAFLYSATVSREAARQRCVQRIIETVFDGSAEGLVLTLLGGGVVSKPEAERIRDMITLAKAKEMAKRRTS
ncbi:MAG TPA: BlaI/MecI/CopY family transcriptional regulator [Planctomycetaceae bacterium]|jgi:predicted transcriptional regulator